MKLLFGLHQFVCIQKKIALTIGNFDGVHLGHQALLRKLASEAKKRQLPAVVLLFEPQPAEYFSTKNKLARLSSLREKIMMMEQCGIDIVCCLRFNQDIANLTHKEFLHEIVLDKLKAQYLLLGHDFRFGQNRRGDIAFLNRTLPDLGCELDMYADYLHDGERISSTNLRHFLMRGQLDEAKELLGRPYAIVGRVVSGDKRAREWGFPTANIQLCRKSSALHGVYCVDVQRNTQWIKGVANIGFRPTLDGRPLVLEVHLLDFSDTLYGEWLNVTFLHQLRDEKRFESLDALAAQIGKDVKAAREYFDCKHCII